MSVKAMSLVWDMLCPSMINGIEFKPGHKYILLAYADHADHQGKNIYPAVVTISKKTGYEDRSVQRLTHDLEQMCVLVGDGMGPRGTNRWFIPFNSGGDKISPLIKFQGDIDDKSLGDIPSGDIPSGDNLTPEFKEPEPGNNNIFKQDVFLVWESVKEKLKDELHAAQFETWVSPSKGIELKDRTLSVGVGNSYAVTWLEQRIKTQAQNILGVYVKFVVSAETEVE